MYAGEADADWIYGMYRPDRDPKFKKSRYSFSDPADFEAMVYDYERVKGITIFQVVKNRPFGDTLENGIELRYSVHTRRLEEPGWYPQ